MGPKSRLDSLARLVRRFRGPIIAAWVVAIAVSAAFVPGFFAAVSYDVAGTNIGPSNSMSQRAQAILDAQFPSSMNQSGSSILLVVQGHGDVYSSAPLRSSLLALNGTLSSLANYTGMSSVYGTEYGLLASALPGLVSQARSLNASLAEMNGALYSLRQNLTELDAALFALNDGVNGTAQLVYGVPVFFASAWAGYYESTGSVSQADQQANLTTYERFGGSGYYDVFYQNWVASFSSPENLSDPYLRAQFAVNESVPEFAAQDPAGTQLFGVVARGLNVSTWDSADAVGNLTVRTFAASLPPGGSPLELSAMLYALGPAPSGAALGNLTVSVFAKGVLADDAYSLGASPAASSVWDLATALTANATAASYRGSPLFTVNATALQAVLRGLGTGGDPGRAALELVSTAVPSDYPFPLSAPLTQGFVGRGNDTMVAVLDFSSKPSHAAIAAVKADAPSLGGTVYVTGSPVISSDLSSSFGPALLLTTAAGIAISLLVVGLLFLSPVAALIPILVAGLSVVISYPAIYYAVVVVGHGSLTFLTPTLTTLLVLGLAVDYSVLMLRRTREERLSGRGRDESVAVSLRWAGEAVLTAGVTVIAAYVVMAVAKVPLFGDVGTAIVIGVSVLLAASMTLLPALEYALGDRLFWPGLRRTGRGGRRLERLAESTLRRRVAISVVIGMLALGAYYVAAGTPGSMDFTRLIPNYPSNQGLAVITQSMGGTSVQPTYVVVTTPTPIVYGNGTFNQTLLDAIQRLTQAAQGSPGVVGVAGPTEPFGSPVGQNLSGPVGSQYLSGMLSYVGKDNRTALILVGLAYPAEGGRAVSALLQMESRIGAAPAGMSLYYGGATRSTYDGQAFFSALLPQVAGVLAAAVYVILLAQLRSAFTPVRLISTIMCGVAFSLALLSLVFYRLLSLPVMSFVPLFVVVTMLGVGIDYDIFFVTRIREEVLHGEGDAGAIKAAVSKVWPTVFGLGLVLASVFGSLTVTGIPMLEEIGAAVSSAALIDVSVVILFFVPALMGMAQRLNWWPSKPGGLQAGDGGLGLGEDRPRDV
ncbi:MAG: MMPL family transporter [Nitrososphaerota archaeon]|nr:MMPL family transporter [Nitrososphaerota archaeon]MDG6940101.1 MMPL family transporter [Nitrososphaerota archaeon]